MVRLAQVVGDNRLAIEGRDIAWEQKSGIGDSTVVHAQRCSTLNPYFEKIGVATIPFTL